MHEGAIAASIVQGILEILEKEKISNVKSATVLIGRLHQVVPQVLQSHYRLLKTEYPPLRASKLIIETVPVRIACLACGQETVIEKPEFACSACGSTAIDITGGREMHLKEISGTRSSLSPRRKPNRRD